MDENVMNDSELGLVSAEKKRFRPFSGACVRDTPATSGKKAQTGTFRPFCARECAGRETRRENGRHGALHVRRFGGEKTRAGNVRAANPARCACREGLHPLRWTENTAPLRACRWGRQTCAGNARPACARMGGEVGKTEGG